MTENIRKNPPRLSKSSKRKLNEVSSDFDSVSDSESRLSASDLSESNIDGESLYHGLDGSDFYASESDDESLLGEEKHNKMKKAEVKAEAEDRGTADGEQTKNVEIRDMDYEQTETSGSTNTSSVCEPILLPGKFKNNTKQKLYKCPNCCYVGSRTNIIGHFKRSHRNIEGKGAICEYCGGKFRNSRSLGCHISQSHDPDRLKCGEKNLKGERVHKCPKCCHVGSKNSALRNHMKICHENIEGDGAKCSHCGGIFRNELCMIHHIGKWHNPDRLKKGKENGNDKIYKCHLCDYQTKHCSSKHAHIKYVHNKVKRPKVKEKNKYSRKNVPFECTVCGYKSHYLRHYNDHMKIHSDDNKGEYSCDFCNSKFDKLKSKERHMNNQHNIRHPGYKCADCDYFSRSEALLKEHKKCHERTDIEKYKFKCSSCNARFVNMGGVKIHQQKIHNYKVGSVYKCELCDFESNSSDGLNRHKRIHNDERTGKFACNFCGAKFERKRDRTVHVHNFHKV